MRILGIESSCDETAAAVVEDGYVLRSNVVHAQLAAHAPFGGVVPEVASREHVTRLTGVVDDAVRPVGGLSGIDAIAVTQGPGLLGALLVGLQFAKGLAYGRNLPFLGVHHLEAHLAAARIGRAEQLGPHVALVVSGGHTHLYAVAANGTAQALGATRDDAAGEAFDKVAKVMHLGYPGGPAIERAAAGGDPAAFVLPRAFYRQGLEFSFSGLKTAAQDVLRTLGPTPDAARVRDFCASFQEAVADVLVHKAVRAAKGANLPGIVLAGGVAANGRLRALLAERAAEAGLWHLAPPKALCTDNAAMVAAAGLTRLRRGERSDFAASARARWPMHLDAAPKPVAQAAVTP